MGKCVAGWLAVAALALAGCSQGDSVAEAETAAKAAEAQQVFLAEAAQWRKQREEELLQPDGWTSLVGLHWLGPGAHYVGSGAGSGIRIAYGPPKLGMVVLEKGKVFFTPESGTAVSLDGQALKGRVQLQTDHDLMPSVLGFDGDKGKLSVLKRGDRYALRIKYADAPSRSGFAGIQHWDTSLSWRMQAKFVPHPPGKTIQIADIVGTLIDSPNPGAVEFEREGKTYRIEALGEKNGELFLIFADRTSGHGSYPAGRYLDAAAPDAQGKVLLDFNRAYNPPCAFTSFATCPLPPLENRLDLRIDAGEKAYVPSNTNASKEL